MGKPLQLPHVTAEPIKRKSALGGRLLSLGIAPLRESPESSTAHRLTCPLWVKSGHSTKSDRCPLCPRKRTFRSTFKGRRDRVLGGILMNQRAASGATPQAHSPKADRPE